MKNGHYFFSLLSPEEQEQFATNFKMYLMRNALAEYGDIQKYLDLDFFDFKDFIQVACEYFDYNQKFVWNEIAQRVTEVPTTSQTA